MRKLAKTLFKVLTGSLVAHLTPNGANNDDVKIIPNNAGKYTYPRLQSGIEDTSNPVNTKPIAPKIATTNPHTEAVPIDCRIGREK